MDCWYFDSNGKDRRLKNWQKWLQIRKKFHQQMYNIQQRTPSQLVLNSAEDLMLIRYKQQLIEYCRIPKIISNRGKPSFWYLPPSLKKFPSLITVMPKAFDFEIPESTITAVHPKIKIEKNVSTSKNVKISPWFGSKYLQERTYFLRAKMKNIEAHYPEIVHLIIFGTSYADLNEVKISDSKLNENLIKEKDNTLRKSENDGILDFSVESEPIIELPPQISLQIEDATFIADSPQEIRKYLVFINYEIGKHDIICKKITLKNTGTIALRYYWHYCSTKNYLKDLIPHRFPSLQFIFPKNEKIILPNDTNEVEIFFKTTRPGIYKETWELRTKPNVFKGTDIYGNVILILHACAEMANLAESYEAILRRIDEGVKNSIVEDTLIEILKKTKVKADDKHGTREKITEKDLFEAINAKFGPPGTLPEIYYYNEELVQQMIKIYNELKTKSDPKEWNYKIEDIHLLISSCNDISKRNYFTVTYNEILKNLYKTNMIENEEQDKYQKIYTLLCVTIDQMSERIYDLRQKMKIPFSETYPAITEEILIKQENLDNNFRGTHFFPDFTVQNIIKHIEECRSDEMIQPQMELLKNVPFEDFEQRYKLYFKEKYGINVDEIKKGKKEKKDGKGKKGGKKSKEEHAKGKKDKGKEKGGKKSKKKEKVKSPVTPLRKESIVETASLTQLLSDKIIINTELPTEDIEEPSTNTLQTYHYNVYITIYTLLGEAINGIVEIIEFLHTMKNTSRNIVRKCIELGIPIASPSPKTKQPKNDFEEILKSIDSFSSLSSDYSTTETKTEFLTDISKSYSDYDFFKAIPSSADISETHEMVDAQTETSGHELYLPSTRIGTMQTDEDDEEFDLVVKIENELSSTSIQYITKPTENKSTQIIKHSSTIVEEHVTCEEPED